MFWFINLDISDEQLDLNEGENGRHGWKSDSK